MTNKEFCEKLIDIANNKKSLYVLGCFGAPLNDKNKKRYSNNYEYNKNPKRTQMILNASSDTFGFDCVCLIKGILWGWNGDVTRTYGGATYRSNDVPDIGANSMINKCNNISTNFENILNGEAVWIDGHIGVYVGNGQVVECSPKWKNCVQITNLGNIATFKNGNYRIWTKHGKLPWITYSETISNISVNPNKKSNADIAKEVIKGLWGNGAERKRRLRENGYDPTAVQILVNKYLLK